MDSDTSVITQTDGSSYVYMIDITSVLSSKLSHAKAAQEIAEHGIQLMTYGWDEYVIDALGDMVLISHDSSGVATDVYVNNIGDIVMCYDDEELQSFYYRRAITSDDVRAMRSIMFGGNSINH